MLGRWQAGEDAAVHPVEDIARQGARPDGLEQVVLDGLAVGKLAHPNIHHGRHGAGKVDIHLPARVLIAHIHILICGGDPPIR